MTKIGDKEIGDKELTLILRAQFRCLLAKRDLLPYLLTLDPSKDAIDILQLFLAQEMMIDRLRKEGKRKSKKEGRSLT